MLKIADLNEQLESYRRLIDKAKSEKQKLRLKQEYENLKRKYFEDQRQFGTEIGSFINDWYAMKPSVRDLQYLNKLAEDFDAFYRGKAFRLTEGSERYVKPPTSWSKTEKQVRWYMKYVGMSGWTGELISADLPKALDLTKLAVLVKGHKAAAILKAGEVVNLAQPQNVVVLSTFQGYGTK